MKRKVLKQFIAVVMSIFMLSSLPTEAFAQESVEENNGDIVTMNNTPYGAEFNVLMVDFIDEFVQQKENKKKESGYPDLDSPDYASSKNGETTYAYTAFMDGSTFSQTQVRVNLDTNNITGIDYVLLHSLDEDGSIPSVDEEVVTVMAEILGIEDFEEMYNNTLESEWLDYWEDGVSCQIWDFHGNTAISINAMSKEKFDEMLEGTQAISENKGETYSDDEVKTKISDFIYNYTFDNPAGAYTIADILNTVFINYDIAYEQSGGVNSEYIVNISGDYCPNISVPEYVENGNLTYLVDIKDGYCELVSDSSNIIAAYFVAVLS